MSEITLIPNASMVNYTNVLTSVPDEMYVTKTETPDSLASLIKNNITIQFSIYPVDSFNNNPAKENIATNVDSF